MFKVVQRNGVLIPEDEKQFQEFLKSDRFIHYVGMLSPPRPGVQECFAVLEYSFYNPSSNRNEFFIMKIVEWSDIVWAIVSIPIEEKKLMEKVANECGLRIADGVPTMISCDGIEKFPAQNERVFTLENKPGHLVYLNREAVTRKILEAEKETIERIYRKG